MGEYNIGYKKRCGNINEGIMMVLGIDWGKRKIGLALGYSEIAIASVYGAIENDGMVFDELKNIVESNDVEEIVIGKNDSEGFNDNVSSIDDFAKECERVLQLPIHFTQEMFTTKEAHKNLVDAGKKNLDRIDDAEAARIILQQYFDVK